MRRAADALLLLLLAEEKTLRGEGVRTCGDSTMIVESRGSSALTRSAGSLGSCGSGKRSGMALPPRVVAGP